MALAVIVEVFAFWATVADGWYFKNNSTSQQSCIGVANMFGDFKWKVVCEIVSFSANHLFRHVLYCEVEDHRKMICIISSGLFHSHIRFTMQWWPQD